MDVPKKSKRLIIWNGGSNDDRRRDTVIIGPVPILLFKVKRFAPRTKSCAVLFMALQETKDKKSTLSICAVPFPGQKAGPYLGCELELG